jgi:hypothetical protein
MKRRSDRRHEKLIADKLRIEAELKNTKPGPQRELLLRQLRLIKTTLCIDDWASSKDCGHQRRPKARLSYRPLRSRRWHRFHSACSAANSFHRSGQPPKSPPVLRPFPGVVVRARRRECWGRVAFQFSNLIDQFSQARR